MKLQLHDRASPLLISTNYIGNLPKVISMPVAMQNVDQIVITLNSNNNHFRLHELEFTLM